MQSDEVDSGAKRQRTEGSGLASDAAAAKAFDINPSQHYKFSRLLYHYVTVGPDNGFFATLTGTTIGGTTGVNVSSCIWQANWQYIPYDFICSSVTINDWQRLTLNKRIKCKNFGFRIRKMIPVSDLTGEPGSLITITTGNDVPWLEIYKDMHNELPIYDNASPITFLPNAGMQVSNPNNRTVGSLKVYSPDVTALAQTHLVNNITPSFRGDAATDSISTAQRDTIRDAIRFTMGDVMNDPENFLTPDANAGYEYTHTRGSPWYSTGVEGNRFKNIGVEAATATKANSTQCINYQFQFNGPRINQINAKNGTAVDTKINAPSFDTSSTYVNGEVGQAGRQIETGVFNPSHGSAPIHLCRPMAIAGLTGASTILGFKILVEYFSEWEGEPTNFWRPIYRDWYNGYNFTAATADPVPFLENLSVRGPSGGGAQNGAVGNESGGQTLSNEHSVLTTTPANNNIILNANNQVN